MVDRPFARHALAISTLGPVHLGANCDLDPTRYVIDGGFAYVFEPGDVVLDQGDAEALIDASRREGAHALLALQRTYRQRAEACIAASRAWIGVAPGIAEEYERRLGKTAQVEADGTHIINALSVGATATQPLDGRPYLPGTALKGAIRTAWLDALNKGQRDPQVYDANGSPRRNQALAYQAKVAGGTFATDAFRFVKVSDARPASPAVHRRIAFAVNHKKELVVVGGVKKAAKGPPQRLETVVAGQYRAFAAEVTVAHPGKDWNAVGERGDRLPRRDRLVPDFATLGRHANRHYLPLLEAEIRVGESRGFLDAAATRAWRAVVERVRAEGERGGLMLLRVGRHSGAESLTLAGARSIRILKGDGGHSDSFEPAARTLWLCGDRTEQEHGLELFGWLLIEVDPRPSDRECESLVRAFLRDTAGDPSDRVRRARAAEGERRRRAAVAADDARVRREEEARERERLEALSPNLRRCEELRVAFLASAGKEPVSGQLWSRSRTLMKEAAGESWSAEERVALASVVEQHLFARVDMGGKRRDALAMIAALRSGADG